ncbi:hypothetical protein [Listeria fleischmannii]|jgi:hypothetical protein|uniref:Two component regulator three Y domain-containing protein n=2 Tax=Listeria fleischmannii TaxID=1069827 RepID=W7DD74_9LIST|nr:hypothetical protein [Listeria fleischmannii]EIA20837.1 hypothetical protein KKC_04758 [Listeria fleischmannii subsp. coloradonensis]EUJ52630.1 hypothetical protein MCOL2_12857 [Listeria fleischmannii FSL S10-1203]MBC1399042.1 hypothetical protein [Listeria fleischmannii]MBC1419878.1 hypothetical protein [Listeria fleischmannii]MBC1427295.1 hypothetical protein [Listeria fleischmannii]
MLHGKHFQNGSDTLVIVFQNAAKPLNDAIPAIYNDEIDQTQVSEMHARYTWIKFAERVNHVDYLFIQDHFSKVYGWYFIDSGKMIYEELNIEISQFIQKYHYKKVIAFGSSKGGTGALLYGLINPFITDVFSLVPQIRVADYINTLCPNEKSLFFANDAIFEQKVNNLFFSPQIYQQKPSCKIYFYTGLQDIQFADLLEYRTFLRQQNVQSTIFLNRGNERHTRLVNQYTPFIFSVLEDLIQGEKRQIVQHAVEIGADSYILKAE